MLRKIKVHEHIFKTDHPTKPYQTEYRPEGQRKIRYRKNFATLGEARRFLTHKKVEFLELKEWEPAPDDNRRLDDLIDLWFKLHGKNLYDIKKRLAKMKATSKLMGNPIAKKITASHWAEYRAKRLEDVSIKTVNNDQTYLNAMFNELIRLGEISQNPITNVRQLKYKQPEMGFLDKDEIDSLLSELKNSSNLDAYLVAKICLSTGARWGEAESLSKRNVKESNVTFINTKGGLNRTIPISEELENEIPKKSGKLFSSCIGAFRSALKRTGIQLPKGQCSHVLRHSFASHFMMNGGNILVLQKILGHSNISDTMKYAHFSKTHLSDAKKFNPITIKM